MRSEKVTVVLAAILAGGAAGVLVSAGCRPKEEETALRVLVADSLARPLAAVAQAFEEANPGVRVVQIPSGSVLAARRLKEGNDQADVLAVADHVVIDELLRPDLADWYAAFAINEVGIAYTDASSGATELNGDSWWKVLAREGVKVAAANPLHDPCGYWTELCWQLADRHYPAERRGGSIVEAMYAKCGQPDSRRSDAEQLLQLLEATGGIDYVFVYRSQARQHNLPFLRLPGQINLGEPRYEEFYGQAEVRLPGRGQQKPFSKRGTTIVYAVTIPRNASQPGLAARYMEFLLSPRGRSLLAAEYLDPLEKAWTYDMAHVPEPLRALLAARQRSPGSSASFQPSAVR